MEKLVRAELKTQYRDIRNHIAQVANVLLVLCKCIAISLQSTIIATCGVALLVFLSWDAVGTGPAWTVEGSLAQVQTMTKALFSMIWTLSFFLSVLIHKGQFKNIYYERATEEVKKSLYSVPIHEMKVSS